MKQDQGWQDVGSLLKHTFGDPNRGCRYCGNVRTYTTETGHTAYLPGTECCPQAIRRQIAWRSDELDQLRKQIGDRENAIRELQHEIETAPTKTIQAQLLAKRDRAQRNLNTVMKDHYTPAIRKISNEIARLKGKLASHERQAVNR